MGELPDNSGRSYGRLLVLVMRLQGTGKSTVANVAAERLGAGSSLTIGR